MSPTTHEVAAAKRERIRREQRHYYPEHLGRPCPHCGVRVVLAVGFHVTCGPEARHEMERRPA